MKSFIYNKEGRTGTKEFLKMNPDIQVTNDNGRIIIEGNCDGKIEISHILHQWLVNKEIISDFN